MKTFEETKQVCADTLTDIHILGQSDTKLVWGRIVINVISVSSVKSQVTNLTSGQNMEKAFRMLTSKSVMKKPSAKVFGSWCASR